MPEIDDSIESIKKRLEELQSFVDEAEALTEALRKLEDVKLLEENPEAWRKKQERKRSRPMSAKQAHASREKRIRQIKDLRALNAGISQAAIAKELGLSAARVNQLEAMIRDEEKSTLDGMH